MAGEQHRRTVRPIVVVDEAPDAALHGHVETDCGFIQEEHLRAMQEGGRDLAFHPFSQRQVSDRFWQKRLQLEQSRQFIERLAVVPAGDPIDRPIAFQRVDHRDVPDQLVSLSHHERNLAEERLLAPVRDMTQDVGRAAGGVEQPREHFEGRGLSRSVRAEKADDLARFDAEGDRLNGLDHPRLSSDEAFCCSAQSGLALGHDVVLGQAFYRDDVHGIVDVGSEVSPLWTTGRRSVVFGGP